MPCDFYLLSFSRIWTQRMDTAEHDSQLTPPKVLPYLAHCIKQDLAIDLYVGRCSCRQPFSGMYLAYISTSLTIRPTCPGLFSPSKLPLHVRRSGPYRPYLIHGSLSTPESTSQTASRSAQHFSCFCRALSCNRPTDHATPSVAINRPHLAIVLRCGLK